MRIVLIMVGAPLFLVSLAAHFFVKWRLRSGFDSDLDDYYYEFEEQHPDYARYLKWSRITFIGMAAGVVMMFIAVAV